MPQFIMSKSDIKVKAKVAEIGGKSSSVQLGYHSLDVDIGRVDVHLQLLQPRPLSPPPPLQQGLQEPARDGRIKRKIQYSQVCTGLHNVEDIGFIHAVATRNLQHL